MEPWFLNFKKKARRFESLGFLILRIQGRRQAFYRFLTHRFPLYATSMCGGRPRQTMHRKVLKYFRPDFEPSRREDVLETHGSKIFLLGMRFRKVVADMRRRPFRSPPRDELPTRNVRLDSTTWLRLGPDAPFPGPTSNHASCAIENTPDSVRSKIQICYHKPPHMTGRVVRGAGPEGGG